MKNLEYRPVSGEFVSVDVFFVISWYLITKIILTEIAEGCFSVARFYERRVRRIVPALLVVVSFTRFGALLVAPPAMRKAPNRSYTVDQSHDLPRIGTSRASRILQARELMAKQWRRWRY